MLRYPYSKLAFGLAGLVHGQASGHVGLVHGLAELGQGCLNHATSSVLVNGSPTNEFHLSRGLRQGDPLSPFLFIIAMEGLHVAIEDAIAAGLYRGITMHTLSLSHFFFADDSRSALSSFGGAMWMGIKFLGSLGTPAISFLKVIGGLGIGSLFSLNQALILKWRWRFFQNPNALWVRVIKAVHGGPGIIPLSFLRKRVGNGTDTKFWQDVWIGEISLQSKFPRLYRLALNKECSICEVWNNGWVFNWSRPIVRGTLLHQLNDLTAILDSVQLFRLGLDSWIWSIGSPSFTVKCTRDHIDNCILPDDGSETIWNRYLPKKINIFLWRAVRDRLPSRWNLSLMCTSQEGKDCSGVDVYTALAAEVRALCGLLHDEANEAKILRTVHTLSHNFRSATSIAHAPLKLLIKPGHVLLKIIYARVNASDEEEEQLFSGAKKDSRVSKASKRSISKEKADFVEKSTSKKLAEIMAKCGVKTRGPDTGLLSTSDVPKQIIVSMNQKAREEWDKKQADVEKLQRADEIGEHVNNVLCLLNVNKEEEYKKRTTAEPLWQQRHRSISFSQPSLDVGPKPVSTSERTLNDTPDTEKTYAPAIMTVTPG
ncbi:RNA-directed DNA polymerase, eukaryota, reverse transcriptase zinc-binding domain protein [Tanacetum coccineum]